MNHDEFEKKLMNMLLAGNDPVLDGLRKQYLNSIVKTREFTGAGFYTNFELIGKTEPLSSSKTFQIGGIHASFNEIKEAFGFILFIEKGYLSFLEGYTLSSDIWPDDYSNVILNYNGPNRKSYLEKLKKEWA